MRHPVVAEYAFQVNLHLSVDSAGFGVRPRFLKPRFRNGTDPISSYWTGRLREHVYPIHVRSRVQLQGMYSSLESCPSTAGWRLLPDYIPYIELERRSSYQYPPSHTPKSHFQATRRLQVCLVCRSLTVGQIFHGAVQPLSAARRIADGA